MRMIDWRLISLLALAGCSQAPEERNASVADDLPVNETVAPRAPEASARQSVLTKLDGSCRLIEEDREEGSYSLRRCSGRGGWQVNWSESDLRQDLTLIGSDRKATELNLSALVAKGAFNSFGRTIEWRGPAGGKPDVLIARMNVAAGTETARPDISRLVVIRLEPSPCLVAVVEPSGSQSSKARIADGKMPACIVD